MSRAATDWAWNQDIKPASLKLVLLSLADRADEEHCCFPSIQRLVNDTGLNRKTIISGLDTLCASGLIAETGEKKGSTQRVKVYRLHLETKQSQKRNGSKIGMVPVLRGNSTEIGTLNSTEIGTQNQSIEPFIEPSNNAPAIADASSSLSAPSDRKPDNKQKTKVNGKQSAEKAFLSSLVGRGVDESLASEWIAVRKSKKLPMSIGAIDLLERELGKANISITEALSEAVMRGWGGFKAEWLANDRARNCSNGQINAVRNGTRKNGPDWDDTSWANDLGGL